MPETLQHGRSGAVLVVDRVVDRCPSEQLKTTPADRHECLMCLCRAGCELHEESLWCEAALNRPELYKQNNLHVLFFISAVFMHLNRCKNV